MRKNSNFGEKSRFMAVYRSWNTSKIILNRWLVYHENNHLICRKPESEWVTRVAPKANLLKITKPVLRSCLQKTNVLPSVWFRSFTSIITMPIRFLARHIELPLCIVSPGSTLEFLLFSIFRFFKIPQLGRRSQSAPNRMFLWFFQTESL